MELVVELVDRTLPDETTCQSRETVKGLSEGRTLT